MSTQGSRQGTAGPLATLVSLRVLVAYLGEKDQFGWWPTSFLSVTGRRFLALNFPRTLLSAGVTSASDAAKDLHDQRIGHAGAFHLFRLPHGLEQDVHRYLGAESAGNLADLIGGRDDAVATLSSFAAEDVACTPGPVRVAALEQLSHPASLRKLASCYRDAFARGDQTFPYFTAA